MKYQFNDGGRAAAGFKGIAGDCVTRAIAIVSGRPYAEIYAALSEIEGNRRKSKRVKLAAVASARNGVFTKRKPFKDYMASIGFKWTPTMHIGSGCKVHLRADELPSGKLIAVVSGHYTAVIDGVIQDTHNPSERGATIYSASYPADLLPKGARKLPNGAWAYKPERCVYGYWRKE
jgi:hypothetical protein